MVWLKQVGTRSLIAELNIWGLGMRAGALEAIPCRG